MNEKIIDNSQTQVYNKFTSESGHWYTQEGDPMYTIIGVNGKERNTNLRDAKLLNCCTKLLVVKLPFPCISQPSLEFTEE